MRTQIADDYRVHGQGVALAVRDYGGDGPDVLCLHGAGFNAVAWDPLARELRGDVRMVAMDERGHGRSSSTPDWSLRARVADIDCVIREVGLRHPLIVGHSMGANLAVLYAGTNLSCRGVVAIEATAVGGAEDAVARRPRDWTALAEEWRTTSTLGWKGTVDEAEAWMDRLAASADDDGLINGIPADDHVAILRRHLIRQGDGRLIRRPTVDDLVAMGRTQESEPPLTRAIFDRVVCPLLLVYGRRYRFAAMPSALESIVAGRPERRLAWLDTGHVPPLEAPRAVARLIREQLSGQRVR